MKKVLFFIVAGLVVLVGFFFFLTNEKPRQQSLINVSEKETISAVVVPHYNGAEAKRQELLKQISQKVTPQKIILVSVNHYNTGIADIIITNKEWNFKDKTIKVEKDVFSQITSDGVTASDETAFLNEHGIKNILPDLAQYLPSAEILPIIIKDKTPKDRVDKLFDKLAAICPKCLLVGSIDFSHYNPNSLAQIHDVMSLSALNNLNIDKAWQAETDSPQTFYLAVKWAKKFNTEHFAQFYHSNSGQDAGSDDAETTSYILGYYTNDKNTPINYQKAATFIIAGDAMFDRLVYHNFRTKGLKHIFDNFGPRVFWGTDLSLLNLEGPISDTPITDDPSPDNLIFNFPPETPAVLKSINIKAVSLANNHSLNAGAKGLATTKQLLKDEGISAIGAPGEINDESVERLDSEIPLSVIAFNYLDGPSQSQIEALIKKEKSDNRFVIVFPHWGNEYQKNHIGAQETLAHKLIEAGADMLVGSHPHVVEDFEIYKGKPIIYSLGNLVFDQTFSRPTQEGLVVAGTIKSDSIEITFLPVAIKNLMPELMRGEQKAQKIRQVFNIDNPQGFEKIRSDSIKIGF